MSLTGGNMKRFILSIFVSACAFIFLIILSFFESYLYLSEMQNQAGHLVQFLNEYVVEAAKKGVNIGSDELMKHLSSAADCRVCLFSDDGSLLADSDTTGAKTPELFFPINTIKTKKEIITSSVSKQNGQYVVSDFYPVEIDNKKSYVICVSLPLNGYDKFLFIQKVGILTGCILLILTVVFYTFWRKALKSKETNSSETVIDLENQINQIKFYSNERISLLSTVLTNMDSGIILFGLDCSILMMNPKAKRLTGAKSSLFFPNQSNLEAEYPSILSKIRDMVQNSMVTKKAFVKDLQTDSGKTLAIRTSVVYSKYIPFTLYGAQAFVTDVTEQRRMEKIKDEFVSNVSHELRTPLTLISGFAETLQNWKSMETKDCERALKIIDIESNRLKRMISQLLDLSHIESRIDADQLGPIDPIKVIQSVSSAIQALAEKRKIHFKFDLSNEKVQIMGDKISIVQIVTNLCENAIKYTPVGGAVLLSVQIKKNNLIVLVQDNGIGIPESETQRIFERFYRVEKSRNMKHGGSGLGLAITKGLVDELGGQISVESRLNVGSTFMVSFPLHKDNLLDIQPSTDAPLSL